MSKVRIPLLLALVLLLTAGAVVLARWNAADDGSSRPPDTEADRVAATSALITVDDLPGYEPGEMLPPDAAFDRGARAFDGCAAVGTGLADDRMVSSGGLYRGRTTMVGSITVAAGGEAEAGRTLAQLSRAELAACLTSLYRTVLELELLPGSTATTDRLPATSVEGADEAVAWRTNLDVVVDGAHVPAYGQLTFVRSGRGVGALLDFQVGGTFADSERGRLAETLASRLRRL